MDFMFNNVPQKPQTDTVAKGLKTPPIRGKWLDEADEIFSYLERHEVQKDSWWKSMSSTLSLLKQAHGIISQSENRIKEQVARIKKLEELSNSDELTSILNRRGFMHAFARELDRVNRDKSQGGLLIMIDLDNFKSINDTYGHDAGDAALKLVASTLDSDIRTMDVAGRLGAVLTFTKGTTMGRDYWEEKNNANDDEAPKVLDSNGTELQSGDSVTLIKDLKVKGAGVTLKRGTVIKNIRIDPHNPDEFDCSTKQVKGLVLRTEFVKKV
ncbi:unnamed protein product [Cyprideis torosa]|uniref:Uncharacterized protein n=1 Tax=Cyprideis torosa TaxID=163714 RepID=A0A7R8WUL9_9CRUS|nr:unnamed protein product [Cyprideis torosa]CAG0906558.1 unnamed protein product [Cyprideis torosa]